MVKKHLRIKYFAFVLCIGLIVLGLLPFLSGDLETKELNESTRKILGGTFVKLTDGYTHYQMLGAPENPVVVLVHGNAAPMCSWDKNMDALVKSGFRVLRYDVFGQGYSDRPQLDRYDRDFYDRQLLELLDRLGLPTPILLLGTSQGGSIAAYFAANHPDNVKKVAFLAPFIDTYKGETMMNIIKQPLLGEYFIRLIGDKMLINPADKFYSESPQQELISQLRAQLEYKGKKRAVLANLRGDNFENMLLTFAGLNNRSMPLLLTWAEGDKLVVESSIRNLRQVLPDIEYYKISNAAHLAHYERPEIINPLLIDFLKK